MACHHEVLKAAQEIVAMKGENELPSKSFVSCRNGELNMQKAPSERMWFHVAV